MIYLGKLSQINNVKMTRFCELVETEMNWFEMQLTCLDFWLELLPQVKHRFAKQFYLEVLY